MYPTSVLYVHDLNKRYTRSIFKNRTQVPRTYVPIHMFDPDIYDENKFISFGSKARVKLIQVEHTI